MELLRRLTLLLSLAILLSGCQPRKTGLFSTLDLEKDGLFYGYEIFIVKGDRATGSESDYYAIVQCAEGRVSPPLIGVVEMVADQVTITLVREDHAGCPSGRFTGTVGFKELTGKFGNKAISLPRRDSFWQ
jgi:hypothetical protein